MQIPAARSWRSEHYPPCYLDFLLPLHLAAVQEASLSSTVFCHYQKVLSHALTSPSAPATGRQRWEGRGCAAWTPIRKDAKLMVMTGLTAQSVPVQLGFRAAHVLWGSWMASRMREQMLLTGLLPRSSWSHTHSHVHTHTHSHPLSLWHSQHTHTHSHKCTRSGFLTHVCTMCSHAFTQYTLPPSNQEALLQMRVRAPPMRRGAHCRWAPIFAWGRICIHFDICAHM
jgi:hypothetical protein